MLYILFVDVCLYCIIEWMCHVYNCIYWNLTQWSGHIRPKIEALLGELGRLHHHILTHILFQNRVQIQTYSTASHCRPLCGLRLVSLHIEKVKVDRKEFDQETVLPNLMSLLIEQVIQVHPALLSQVNVLTQGVHIVEQITFYPHLF